jgi:uroporphyrin-III C-methyltransferase
VISRGTCPDQESVAAPLVRIAEAAEGLPTPALLVVGEVVAVADLLRAERPVAAAL